MLVDCPPSLNLLTINAMAAAHSVLVPLQCEFFALEGLSQLLQTVEQVKQSLNPELTIHGIVLTMFDSRNNLSGQVVADVRAHMGEAVYETVIPRNVRVSEAPSYGKPVLLYDFKCDRQPGLSAARRRDHPARAAAAGRVIDSARNNDAAISADVRRLNGGRCCAQHGSGAASRR